MVPGCAPLTTQSKKKEPSMLTGETLTSTVINVDIKSDLVKVQNIKNKKIYESS